MVSVGAHTAACDFGIDLCTASLGVLKFFKHKHRRAFAHHKSVARRAERTRSVCRIIIACRQSVHGVKATYSGRENSCFGTTCDDCVGLSETDKVESVDYGIVR